ncbi:PAS domain S-box protein [Methanococcoides sp. SA1]|nr:PAS domain S-box protein [Methanococcoides sp. SA1]
MVETKDILDNIDVEGSTITLDIFKSIFDDIPLIIILVDYDGRVEYINKTATVASGMENNDSFGILVGETLKCINSFKNDGCGNNKECANCSIRNSLMHTFKTGENIYKRDGEFEIVTNDQLVKINYYISTIRTSIENGSKVSLILDDISEIKSANQALERKLGIEKTLSSISSMLIFSKDLDVSINYALEKLCNLCNNHRSYIFLFNDDGTHADNTHEFCVAGLEPQKQNLQNVPLDLYPWWMNKLYGDEAIYIEDVSSLPSEALAEKKMLMAQGIRSVIVLPLYINNKIAGFIGTDSVLAVEGCKEEDISTLNMLAPLIGSALERKRSEIAAKKNEEKYSNLVEKGNDGIVILQDFVLKYVNKKMLDMSGYSFDELIGKDLTYFFMPNYKDLIKEII